MHDYTLYFKQKVGFERFIDELYKKYKSLSKFSGVIKLDNISSDEARAFSKLFGLNYKENDTIKINIKKFIDIMNNSKYVDFDIGILVSEYLKINLVTNKEKKTEYYSYLESYFKLLITDDSIGSLWIKNVIDSKVDPYNLLVKRYNKDKVKLKNDLVNIINLVNNLPNERMLLPLYASKYTMDPHYLDLGSANSNLFFYALAFINNTDYPVSRSDKIRLLSYNNIDIDSISNYVITYNLISSKEYINNFAINKETLILNIQNIIDTLSFDTKLKKVFVFENPSILSEILQKKIDVSVIISGGFPNTSVYLLLDSLVKMGNKIYYNGDFDPEGLVIACKLKKMYGDNLEFICYSEDDYSNCVSNKKISFSRLKKLEQVDAFELSLIKKLLLSKCYGAYQESNKDRIICEIRKIKDS